MKDQLQHYFSINFQLYYSLTTITKSNVYAILNVKHLFFINA